MRSFVLILVGLTLAGAGLAGPASAATFTVGTTADPSGSCNPTVSACSLRQIIGFVDTAPSPGSTIVVPSGTYDLTQRTALNISQSLTIEGVGARTTTVAQPVPASHRVFDVEHLAEAVPTVVISGLEITGGTAGTGDGGDVLNAGDLTLSEDWITDGRAASGGFGGTGGGAVSNEGGTLQVTHSLISANRSGFEAGGIFNVASDSGPSTLEVDNSTISGNTAADLGGGIVSSFSASNSVHITNSTIADNDGGNGDDSDFNGGGLLSENGQGGPIDVQNSIVAFNTVNSGRNASNCGAAEITSLGFNIETGTDCGFTSTGDLQSTDPQFTSATPQNNGGNTDTLGLSPTSPAINAIPSTAASCGGTDQRDVPRPQGTGCDIGAFELNAPAVTSIAPASGPAGGGTAVTITGSGFVPAASTVSFGATPASTVNVTSATQIVATAPPGSGTVDVTVTTAVGPSATTAADQFTYIPAPTVTSVSPSSGPMSGGTSVTITGTNFTGATSVSFGATPVPSFTVNSNSQITTTSPAGSGTVDVTVTTPGGTNPSTAADQFTYIPAPTVTSVSPSSGPMSGGTSVTITGTNFTGATSVSFGATPVPSFTVNSNSHITATSPAGSGTVDVTVTSPSGTNPSTAADQYTYTANPPPSPKPPSITEQNSITTGTTTATLQASANPGGLPTNGYFQYGLDPRYTGGGPLLYTQSTPPQTVGSGFNVQAVMASLTGLLPNARYHWRFIATSSAGTVVGPDQTFMTHSDPPPPPPVLGATVNVSVTHGDVFVKPPPGKTLGKAGDQAAKSAGVSPGAGFLPLTEARQIPTGSEIDTLHGGLELVTAGQSRHQTQTATLSGGVYKLTQSRSGPTKALATLTFVYGAFAGGPSTAICSIPRHVARDAGLSSSILQTLHASARGRFRTTGRYGAATVRGTVWTITDQCNGTLFHAIVHAILIQDFVRHISFLLPQGHSYLARAVPEPRPPIGPPPVTGGRRRGTSA